MMLSLVVSGGPTKDLLSRISRYFLKHFEISLLFGSNSAAAMLGTSRRTAEVK
jgi:hypothetical protein